MAIHAKIQRTGSFARQKERRVPFPFRAGTASARTRTGIEDKNICQAAGDKR